MKAALSRAEKLGTGRPEDVKHPVLCLLEYNDGFRARGAHAGRSGERISGRVPVKGRTGNRQHLCYVPTENSNNFSMLVHGIAQMYKRETDRTRWSERCSRRERCRLLMESAYQGHKRLETPMLNVSYKAPTRVVLCAREGLVMAHREACWNQPEDRQNSDGFFLHGRPGVQPARISAFHRHSEESNHEMAARLGRVRLSRKQQWRPTDLPSIIRAGC